MLAYGHEVYKFALLQTVSIGYADGEQDFCGDRCLIVILALRYNPVAKIEAEEDQERRYLLDTPRRRAME